MDPPDPASERLQQAIKGDGVALKVLLLDIHDRLMRLISSRIPVELRRTIDMDDILIETHAEVFRLIEKFEPRGEETFRKWVTTIALNRLRNAIKHERAQKRGGGRQPITTDRRSMDESSVRVWDMVAGTSHTPSRSVSKREAVRAVKEALALIAPDYRQAVLLVHIEGLPIRDAAERMGKTEPAVHGLCRRGMKQLQQKLGTASRFLSGS